jgi:outer membrane protein assembly factor BamB
MTARNGAAEMHWERIGQLGGLAVVVLLALAGPMAGTVTADDWPQWMGPTRNDVWAETGVVETFPAGGAPVKWRVPVGGGYSGPAVVQGKVYLTDYQKQSGDVANDPGTRTELQGKERVLCLDAATGKELWKYEYDCPYQISYACGPRATPTVAEGTVYALGAEGHLAALSAETGKVVWSVHLPTVYKVEVPIWGYTSHPLVVGDKLFTLAGGEGSLLVALDRKTGKEIWRSLSASEIGYCPPTLYQVGRTTQLVLWHPESINSVDPETGKPFWSVPLVPDYKMSITAPQLSGNKLFTSGIGNKSVLLELDEGRPAAKELWRGQRVDGVQCVNSSPVIVGDTIYASNNDQGDLVAVDLATGKRLWKTFDPTTGDRRAKGATVFLTRNGNRFFLANDQGDLIIAELSRAGYKERGRTHVVEPTGEAFGRSVVWSHPAYSGQAAFWRNDKELVCVDLQAR